MRAMIVTVALLSGLLTCLHGARAERQQNLAHADVPDLPATEDLDRILQLTGDLPYTVVEADSLPLLAGAVYRLRPGPGFVDFGAEAILAGADLEPGVYLAADDIGLDTGEYLAIPMGELLVVGGTAAIGDEGADVSCRTGYYACCYVEKNSGGKKKAKCRPDSQDDSDCDAGGKGSISCGWTSQLRPAFEALDE